MVTNMSRVHWGRSEINWKPDGYELRVTAFVYAREADILARTAVHHIDHLDVHVRIEHGTRTESTSGTSVEPGELVFFGPDLLRSVTPSVLRAAVDAWVADAVSIAEREEAEDNRLADQFLVELRRELDPATGLPAVFSPAA